MECGKKEIQTGINRAGGILDGKERLMGLMNTQTGRSGIGNKCESIQNKPKSLLDTNKICIKNHLKINVKKWNRKAGNQASV